MDPTPITLTHRFAFQEPNTWRGPVAATVHYQFSLRGATATLHEIVVADLQGPVVDGTKALAHRIARSHYLADEAGWVERARVEGLAALEAGR